MAAEMVLLQVDRMTCNGCAEKIRQALEHHLGVIDVVVSWRDGLAQVIFDTDQTDVDQILANEIFRDSYPAELIYPSGCC